MKYMTFNNSCSYAGVANLLEDFEIEIQDYELAIEMRSPYIFKYDEYFKKYISGAMLQNEKYFNYSKEELEQRLMETTFIGHIVKKHKSKKENIDQIEEIEDSIKVLDEYKSKIIDFCKKEQSVEVLKAS